MTYESIFSPHTYFNINIDRINSFVHCYYSIVFQNITGERVLYMFSAGVWVLTQINLICGVDNNLDLYSLVTVYFGVMWC